ncbi:MAG: amidase family protein [Alphaproteobacteria bacterium]
MTPLGLDAIEAELDQMTSLSSLSALAMLEGYRQRRFTPVDVVEAVIDALEAADERLNILVTPMFAEAREAAAQAAAAWASGTPEGALCGVPVTVKDLIYLAGVPAHAGAPTLRDFVPDVDAAVVTRLRAAGAVITGKTTTCESGYKLTADSPLTGITRNPWDPTRTSGGSSGGAAAGVASGAGPLALGTDAVGSIRVPSSFCGVFGIKPTFGLVPRAPGFFPPSWGSLAHTGPIGRRVADVALLLEVIAGFDMRDAVSLPQPPRRFDLGSGRLDGVTIAVSPDFGYAAVDPAVRAAFAAAVDSLADLGADIRPAGLTFAPDVLEAVLKPIGFTEQAAAVGDRSEQDLALSEPEFRATVDQGLTYAGTDYVKALHERAKLRGLFLGVFEQADILVTPTVAVTAFEAGTIGTDVVDGQSVDRHLGWSPFSWPINLAGLPAASIACGFDPAGLPIGLQIVGPALGEDVVLKVAAAFEAARATGRPWPETAPVRAP